MRWPLLKPRLVIFIIICNHYDYEHQQCWFSIAICNHFYDYISMTNVSWTIVVIAKSKMNLTQEPSLLARLIGEETQARVLFKIFKPIICMTSDWPKSWFWYKNSSFVWLVTHPKVDSDMLGDWEHLRLGQRQGARKPWLCWKVPPSFFLSPKLSFNIKAKIFHSNPDIFQ